ncbi:MAG TPA: hypothetical protein VGO33_16360 [Gemmatimonadaceae bacterium]|jgi:hypothetical protein|nr:hypothetical protein [Gemmatimonadaceae bacterium]
MIRDLLASAVAVLIMAPVCGGQTPDSSRSAGLELLAIPEGQPIMCRVPTRYSDDPRAAGLVMREFRIGVPTAPVASWPRQITISFDSVGHPRFLFDEVNHNIPRYDQGIAAHFTPDGQVTGYNALTTIDTVAVADAMERGDVKAAIASARHPVSRALLASEAARVVPLARWLWEHRCERPSK